MGGDLVRTGAEVALFRGRLVVTTLSRAFTGWLPDGTVAVPDGAGDAELGAAVVAACSRSGEGMVPAAPGEVRPQDAEILRVVGAPSQAEFQRRASLVGVNRCDSRYTLIPMRRKRGGSFVSIDQAEEVADPDDAALGAAVRAAMERSMAADAK